MSQNVIALAIGAVMGGKDLYLFIPFSYPYSVQQGHNTRGFSTRDNWLLDEVGNTVSCVFLSKNKVTRIKTTKWTKLKLTNPRWHPCLKWPSIEERPMPGWFLPATSLLKTDWQTFAKKHVVKVIAAQRADRPMLPGRRRFVSRLRQSIMRLS